MDNALSATSSETLLSRTLREQRAAALDQIHAAWELNIARVEEQLTAGWKQNLALVAEERFQEMSQKLEEAFSAQLEDKVSELRTVLRSDLAGRLNQCLRRLRSSQDESELYANLLDVSGVFCRRSALMVVEGSALRGEGSRDFSAEGSGHLAGMQIALTEAPALHSAVQARDTTIAENTQTELSPAIAEFLGNTGEAKAGLFPIVAREATRAVLCTSGGDAGHDGLEMLALMASSVLELLLSRDTQQAGLVNVADSSAAGAAEAAVPEWATLPPEDRELHSSARIFARVQVAEMRLFRSAAVKDGRARHDLYSALKSDIDAARESFQRDFVAHCGSMIDYVHQELLRTLAHEDASLLGPAYPGPLV
jgi:hypothetical protein